MNCNSHGRYRLLVACTAVIALVGCQREPTTVKGLVTLDGKPLAIHDGMRGTVVFQPTMAEGVTLNGMIDSAGRYELAAGSSVDVTPSAYWVTVSAVELVPATEDRPQSGGRRITPAKYASATDSGFRVEVVPGPNEVNLSLKSDVEPPPEPAADAPAEPLAEPTPAATE